MILFTGWGVEEIEKLTISEVVEYINNFRKIEAEKLSDFLKGFAAYNLQSARIAFNGKEDDCRRFLEGLKKEVVEENDVDDQFRGVDFGE